MVQTFKILHGYDKVNSESLFVRADQANIPPRSATGPLNLRHQAARLEVRRNFFSLRVVEEWNKMLSSIKMASSVKSFKNRYKKHKADMVVSTWKTQGTGEETPVWTTPGPRHSLRGPTWAIGSLQYLQVYQVYQVTWEEGAHCWEWCWLPAPGCLAHLTRTGWTHFFHHFKFERRKILESIERGQAEPQRRESSKNRNLHPRGIFFSKWG